MDPLMFYSEYRKLFPPTNSKPTEEERTLMFEVANRVDTQVHKPTACGRCYYNARAAVMRHLKIK